MSDTRPGDAAASDKKVERPGWVSGRVVVAAVLLLAVYAGYSIFLRAHPLEGEPAPSFVAPMLDGAVFDMAEHLGNSPILLDFWAMWCPPCREALPKVAAAAEQYAAQGLVVCAVNIGEPQEAVKTFLSGRALSLPVALDGDNSVASAYGVQYLPTLVFIDRDGIVKRVSTGAMSEAALARSIRQIL